MHGPLSCTHIQRESAPERETESERARAGARARESGRDGLTHTHTQQQYLLELPPGFEADADMLKKSTITVDEEAIDRQYRKLFGPPDAKNI